MQHTLQKSFYQGGEKETWDVNNCSCGEGFYIKGKKKIMNSKLNVPD